MEAEKKTNITVESRIFAPVSRVWKLWNTPTDIEKWNKASDDWHTPYAKNNLTVGGKFLSKMEAKDGSTAFEFSGIYDEIIPETLIRYTMDDGRKVTVIFAKQGDSTKITETFEAESTHPFELQKEGWQAILDNFSHYVEQIAAS